MTLRKLFSTLVLVSGIVAVGCGPDCRLMCEEQEDADCFGDNDARDCEYDCKHTEDLVRNAECDDEWTNYLLCLDGLEDICDVVAEPCASGERCKDPKCDNELDDLTDCFNDYCREHPKNNECELGPTRGAAPTGA